ncbi:hypothetical protein [Nonomuraea sp. NPDC049141]|uniref:hypothetical protein n=1 Tax=Nonomuraea sp. NPDC049141 TaxID=3155500 RepID=UPI0033E09240
MLVLIAADLGVPLAGVASALMPVLGALVVSRIVAPAQPADLGPGRVPRPWSTTGCGRRCTSA